jgi:hypothetical protein
MASSPIATAPTGRLPDRAPCAYSGACRTRNRRINHCVSLLPRRLLKPPQAALRLGSPLTPPRPLTILHHDHKPGVRGRDQAMTGHAEPPPDAHYGPRSLTIPKVHSPRSSGSVQQNLPAILLQEGERVKRRLSIVTVAALLASCATELTRVQEGMLKEEVISRLGNPDGFQRSGEYEALRYTNRCGWCWDRADHSIILRNGRVIEYGPGQARARDLDTNRLILDPLR